jgi:signal transduction histidine kinase
MAVSSVLRRLRWPGGLSARLLILTIVFVMLADLMVLGPSMADFDEAWMVERVRLAEEASVAVELAPLNAIPQRKTAELLQGAGVVTVSVSSGGLRRLILAGPPLAHPPEIVDLRRRNGFERLVDPFDTLIAPNGRMLRIIERPQFRDGEYVDVVAPETPLKALLWQHLATTLLNSLFTSAVAGLLVYFSLNLFLVRPMRRITEAMERFRARPDDPEARIPPSGRRDEIGRAEVELGRMQEDLLAALQSRARLAALGEAVAKINHDLRNILTSAQIASDRLASSGDPKVAQALPRLERALDRALRLAQDVLAYGKSEEPPPAVERLDLARCAEIAAEDAGLTPEGVALRLELPPGFQVFADPDQLHRMLVNLFRNARQAMEAQPRKGVQAEVRLSADQDAEGCAHIVIADNGPGLPAKALDHLFQPFSGSARAGGAGLGLAIARELARGHGGDLTLAHSGPEGAAFELTLPARAIGSDQ